MVCPECSAKISQKHYDPVFEWYECSKCEGCFTPDEILEAEMSKHPARKIKDRRTSVADVALPTPAAKGKKRQTAQEAESDLEDNLTKAISEAVRKAPDVATKHRDTLPGAQVIPIMADEIQAIYQSLGGEIDFMNAQDKALTLFRDLAYHGRVSIRDQAVDMKFCKQHA